MNVDQERVRDLLKETVILLCKNGLKFKTNVKVQGLIGITLDNEDIFLVQIDEKINNPLNTDLPKNDEYNNGGVRTPSQPTNCFEPMKWKAGTNQDSIFAVQNVLTSTVVEVKNVKNGVRFQDWEACSTFNNNMSLSGEQLVRISQSTPEPICHIKSEDYEEQQTDSVLLKQQNSGMYATQSIAHLPVTVNDVNTNKPTRLVHNRSLGLSATLVCSGTRKNRIKLINKTTDKFSPPALQAAVSKKSCPSLEGINGRSLRNTIKESRNVLESPNYSFVRLPNVQKNQSLDAHLSKVNPDRIRGSHRNLEALLLSREKTRLRVRKHRLKKKLAMLAIKNEANI